MANVETVKQMIAGLPIEQSIMLISPHGMGKSSIVKQMAKEMNFEFVDVRLSQSEVGDIKGMPDIDKEAKATIFYKSWWWPRDPDSRGIILLDEINRASREAKQCIFELVLDRKLDGDPLPDGWRIMAAINGGDQYDVDELDHAFFDRFYVMEFRPTVDNWFDWAVENNIHRAITSFIRSEQEYLDPPEEMNSGTVYPSRRSWEFFNNAMNSFNAWETRHEGIIQELGIGWLGNAAGIAFCNYFINDFRIVAPLDILNKFDEVKGDIQEMFADPSAVATLTNAFARYVKELGEDFTSDQFGSTKKLIRLLPKEQASGLWSALTKEAPFRIKVVELRKNDREFVKYITSLFVNPA